MKANEDKPFYLKQLERTFENRVKMNPRYSLRAFSRDLGISAPRLSGVLNRKFGLSQASAEEICTTLRYDKKITEAFVTSVQAHHSRSPKTRKIAEMKIAGRKRVFDQLELDRFEVVSDWYHFALMELVRYANLTSEDSSEIAKQLKISNREAKSAISRLLCVGLLKIEDGFLMRTGSYFIGNQVPNLAIKSLNAQLIAKAAQAIHSQTIQERDLRTLTLAVSEKQMPEFTKLFDEFQTKVRNLAEKENEKTDVYAWTMQFYKLSERKES